MSMPIIRRATELPVTSWNEWDNDVRLVKAAIRALENGIFDQPSMVVEAMGRDDRISGVLETRTGALPALPLMMEPRGDGRQKKAVANELEERFEDFYSDAALSELQQWALLLGVGIAENVWVYEETRWWPQLKVWHPRHLIYRQDTKSFWIQTQEGPREVIPGDGQWVLYAPYGESRGWMHGKVRSLYVSWLMRCWCNRDWARYNEVHGLPIKKVVTPPGAQEDDKNKFVGNVAALGSESTVVTPRVHGGGGPGDTDRYDLELLEATSMNWQTFKEQLDKTEANIAINLLGQNLSTEVKGGSYAAAAAHMKIRDDILQSDAERLGQCLRKQSIAWWALHNFGSAELAPMPKWKTKAKTPEERTAVGTSMDGLGKGITSLRSAGVKVDVDKVVEHEEIPTTGPWEEPPMPETPPPGAPGAKPPAGPRSGQPPLERPTARASIYDQQRDIENEGQRAAAPLLAQDQGDAVVPSAAVEGQTYVDGLGDDGTPQLQDAFSSTLSGVMKAVTSAKDFAHLRRMLLDLYPNLSAEDEAELLHHGMVMAELAGRFAARKEAGMDVEPSEDETDEED